MLVVYLVESPKALHRSPDLAREELDLKIGSIAQGLGLGLIVIT